MVKIFYVFRHFPLCVFARYVFNPVSGSSGAQASGLGHGRVCMECAD